MGLSFEIIVVLLAGVVYLVYKFAKLKATIEANGDLKDTAKEIFDRLPDDFGAVLIAVLSHIPLKNEIRRDILVNVISASDKKKFQFFFLGKIFFANQKDLLEKVREIEFEINRLMANRQQSQEEET